MKVVCQADDPFVCFGAKPDKGFGVEISDATGSRQGSVSQELNKGTQRKQLATGKAEWLVDTGAEVTSRHEREFRVSEGRPSQDESALLVVCRIFARNTR